MVDKNGYIITFNQCFIHKKIKSAINKEDKKVIVKYRKE